MSTQPSREPECNEVEGAIALVIDSKPKDLGNFEVRRVLPSARRQRVGPFIFFDHMGPADFSPGQGLGVRPHPHIGLATVTYLFDGVIRHQDSLGFGLGKHYCAGSRLALLEGRIGIDALLDRIDDVEYAGSGRPAVTGFAFRGPETLPVRFRAT